MANHRPFVYIAIGMVISFVICEMNFLHTDDHQRGKQMGRGPKRGVKPVAGDTDVVEQEPGTSAPRATSAPPPRETAAPVTAAPQEQRKDQVGEGSAPAGTKLPVVLPFNPSSAYPQPMRSFRPRPGQQSNLDPRRVDVVAALKHSWEGYRKNAWGKDEYFPLSNGNKNWGGAAHGIGATMIDALDTLIIAGLDDEAADVIAWCDKELTYNQNAKVSMFETTIRILGGLLSAYHLTNNKRLAEQALDLANRMKPAFDTRTGVPDNYVNLQSGAHEGAAWIGRAAILSEFGSLQMELKTLSAIHNDPSHDERSTKAIRQIKPHCPHFCPKAFQDGNPAGMGNAGLGSFGDSFYEYMLKTWILTGKTEPMFREMWDKAAQHVIGTSSRDGPFYIPNGMETGNTMEHLACFSGGLFALSYIHTNNSEHLQVAENIAKTCHFMYTSSITGLSADVGRFNNGKFFSSESKYILRPETVETYFYLWKVTKDPKYRDWGHDVLKACNKHLKVPNGYVGSLDVNSVPTPQNDNMETFWLAETLKYLYLLFSEDELVDLTEVVFNTEAHPLRVFQRPTPSPAPAPSK